MFAGSGYDAGARRTSDAVDTSAVLAEAVSQLFDDGVCRL